MRGQRSTATLALGVIFVLLIFIYNYEPRSRDRQILQDSLPQIQPQPISAEDDIDNLKKQFQPHKGKDKAFKSDRKLNVLFMITDDMRPQLGCYAGEDFANPAIQQKMLTPHLDDLASKSLLLKRGYTQYSLCGPSRASMLTSRRPDTTRIYGNDLYWREAGGNFTTLPQYFKERGYRSVGMGKIYHQFKSSNNQDPISWSEPHYDPPYADLHYYKLDDAGYLGVTAQERSAVTPLTDEHAVLYAKKKLKELAPEARSGRTPFFMAFGFSKPHLNFVCPQKFFKMYQIEQGEQYMSHKSWQTPTVSQYCNMANVTINKGVKRITDAGLRHLRRAYFACISYVDSMVGELLRTLDDLSLSDSTVVSFVADHGHHLGENEVWGKQTNFESSIHIPMMIHVPGKTEDGIVSRSLIEGVDWYPTIVEAAGLDVVPKCPEDSMEVSECTEGRSVLNLIEHPEAQIKPAAFSQLKKAFNIMEYSIRTDRYKFIQYAKMKKTELDDGLDEIRLEWEHSEMWTELYDLRIDPEEMVNRTDHNSYSQIRDFLEFKIRDQFDVVKKVRRISK